MKNLYLRIPENIPDTEGMVLATVVRTSGSVPQKPGNSALFDRSGLVSGTVGGGVLEGKVQEIAGKSVKSKKSALYRFSLDNTKPSGEDAICGGAVTILADSSLAENLQAFNELRNSAATRTKGVLITLITNIYAESVTIRRYWTTSEAKSVLPRELLSVIRPEVIKMIKRSDAYDFKEIELPVTDKAASTIVFLQSVIPPPRLIIAGAGHIGKALSEIGQMLDFEITVLDDRKEFANHNNIPSADHFITGDIGKALSEIDKGEDTYIVIVTRGHRDDADALKACIGSPAAYIGMIGSRNKVGVMHRDFVAGKWATEEQWKKIHAPVGIEINSRSVEEIAVSIAAQLIQVKNRIR
jgi:xanthine dehydrogenase accessory factor